MLQNGLRSGSSLFALSTGISIQDGICKTYQASLHLEMDWAKVMVKDFTGHKWVKEILQSDCSKTCHSDHLLRKQTVFCKHILIIPQVLAFNTGGLVQLKLKTSLRHWCLFFSIIFSRPEIKMPQSFLIFRQSDYWIQMYTACKGRTYPD